MVVNDIGQPRRCILIKIFPFFWSIRDCPLFLEHISIGEGVPFKPEPYYAYCITVVFGRPVDFIRRIILHVFDGCGIVPLICCVQH